MANVSGTGTVWGLPNYLGELYTADHEKTPILTMIGGLADGSFNIVDNFQFVQGQTYEHETAAQNVRTETESLTAPTAISYVRGQQVDTIELKHRRITVSYKKQSVTGRISGVTGSGMTNAVMNEKDYQIKNHLIGLAREEEWTLLQGTYQLSTGVTVADQQRGLIEQASDASNTVAAGDVDLSESLINNLLRTMYGNGAPFAQPVFIANAFQKQKLSEIYGLSPRDRNIGGVDIQSVETDFGVIGVVLDSFQPAATLTVAEMSVIKPVALPVPDKGILFVEELSKSGASEDLQLYGQIGFDKGPNWMHGTITGLTTS